MGTKFETYAASDQVCVQFGIPERFGSVKTLERCISETYEICLSSPVFIADSNVDINAFDADNVETMCNFLNQNGYQKFSLLFFIPLSHHVFFSFCVLRLSF